MDYGYGKMKSGKLPGGYTPTGKGPYAGKGCKPEFTGYAKLGSGADAPRSSVAKTPKSLGPRKVG